MPGGRLVLGAFGLLAGRFLVAQIPFQGYALALGVTNYALSVAPELGVMRRQEREAGIYPFCKALQESGIAEDSLDFPVRHRGAQVDDLGPCA